MPLYVLALGFLVPVVAGCGGSDGGSGGGGSSVPATVTGATVRIAWPERSRAPLGTELSSARSARVVFPKASSTGTDVTLNIDRDTAQTAAYTGTYTVPSAILKSTGVFVATFFSDPAEAGTTVGTAAGTLSLTGTSLEAGTIVVAGTVRNVAILPPATLKVGDAPIQLLVRATDAKGATVAVSDGSVVWSVVSGGSSIRLTKAGLLTAVAVGTATVTASLDGVTAAPTTITVDDAAGTTQTQVLPLVANDLAYDPISNRIWATIPSNAATSPTTVVAINPATGAVTKTIAFGAEPNKIAVTDNGRYAYVSVDADGSIRRLDLTTGTQVATYVIGQGTRRA